MAELNNPEASQVPTAKYFIPRWMKKSSLPENYKGFRYYEESLAIERPSIGRLILGGSSQIMGIVSLQEIITYSDTVPSHNMLWEAMGLAGDESSTGKGANLQIEELEGDTIVDLNGNRELIMKTIEFLKRSGLHPDAQVKGSFRNSELEHWTFFRNDLENILI